MGALVLEAASRLLASADPAQSEASRRKLLGSLADTDTLILGTHFAPPTAGLVVTHENAYRLAPVPATPRTVLH